MELTKSRVPRIGEARYVRARLPRVWRAPAAILRHRGPAWRSRPRRPSPPQGGGAHKRRHYVTTPGRPMVSGRKSSQARGLRAARRRGIALRRHCIQRMRDDATEVAVQQTRERLRVDCQMCRGGQGDRTRVRGGMPDELPGCPLAIARGALEGRKATATDEFVKDHAERVDVRRRGRAFPAQLLGCRVLGCENARGRRRIVARIEASAMPKSSSLATPSLLTRMLDGLRSRCTTSCACAWATAAQI